MLPTKNLWWFPRNPSEELRLTSRLSPDARGAYSMITDLYFQNGGALTIDDRYFARQFNSTRKVWQKAFQEVLSAGLITVVDKRIVIERSDQTIFEQKRLHEARSEAGRQGGKKRSENALNPKRAGSKVFEDGDRLDKIVNAPLVSGQAELKQEESKVKSKVDSNTAPSALIAREVAGALRAGTLKRHELEKRHQRQIEELSRLTLEPP